jgi:leucyl aminopeptidase
MPAGKVAAVLVEATTDSPLASRADTIAVGVFDGEGVARDLPGGELGALLASGEARTEFKRLAVLHASGRRFIVVGLGERRRLDAERARVAAAVVHGRAREIATEVLCWELPERVEGGVVVGLVEGTLLHAYRFERYNRRPDLGSVGRLVISAGEDVSSTVERARLVTEAQNRARDLGNTPANDLPPELLASYASELAERRGLPSETLDEQAIRQLGMGAFAAVAQGSQQEARLIRIDYDGAGPDAPRLALVGKAVTFDSGGLSLKPASSMEEMKFDMCGGAAVIEAVGAVAALGLPVNLTGIVGATENLPSGTAIKPGDIVRAIDGTTIEINNTDAEGRLVLADCISYARRIGCERIVDLATLTGGVVVALGSVYAGLLSNDDGWAEAVLAAARAAGEPAWRLPLHPEYADLMKGRYAKLSNRSEKREASTITGAEFLHQFAGEVPWVHLDIAGTAYDVRRPYFDKGATGYGVRLVVELAERVAGAGG